MIDGEVGFSQEHFDAIEKIYFEFNKTVAELAETEHHCRYFDRFKDELEAEGITKEFAANFEVDWQLYYNKFRARCAEICLDPKELANIAVILCYQKYPPPQQEVYVGGGRHRHCGEHPTGKHLLAAAVR